MQVGQGGAAGAGGAGGIGAGDSGDLANRFSTLIAEQQSDMRAQLDFQKQSSALNMQFQAESSANARRDALANSISSATQRITQAIR